MLLEEIESPINGKVKVVRSLGLGKYIQVGGLTQSGGIVESIWKSALRKLKNSKTQKLKTVLILGLGGGSAAKVVRKNWPGVKITGVDIDPVIVELGTRHLSLDTSKVKIVIQDAYEFVNSKSQAPNSKYDLILIDLYNGHKFPEKFEKNAFLRNVKKLMTKDGVVIFNRLYGSDHRAESMRFGRKLEKFFKHINYVYPQANVALICYN